MGQGFNPNIERVAPEQPEVESDTFPTDYDRFQKTIEIVNDHTFRGHLIKAGKSLLEASQWLSENVEALSEVALSDGSFKANNARAYAR